MKRPMLILLLTAVYVITTLPVKADPQPLLTNGWWGIRASYSLKWYDYSSGGRHHSCNFFGQSGLMQGVRFGIPIQPTLYGDWGISTGPFMEIYSAVNDEETKRIEDVEFYLPLHAMWRRQTSRWINVFAETGPGFTWGIIQKIIDPKNSQIGGYHLPYNDGTPRRFNCYWDIGAGFSVKMFRFSIVYSVGLTRSDRYLSTMGGRTEFFPARPYKLSFDFAVVF